MERFIVNTHKRAELFENFFRDNEYEGHSVTLVHEPDLLETGGGIKNAERYLGSDAVRDLQRRHLDRHHICSH